MDAIGDTATVAVHINRIREKLGPDEDVLKLIETVWGPDTGSVPKKCDEFMKSLFFLYRELKGAFYNGIIKRKDERS